MAKQPAVLCILDGWGHRPESKHNAIAAAHTPNWDRFMHSLPHSLIGTSGLDVGLPEGQMGNSEVGHMTIGSGRIIMQDLPRIDQAIADGSLKNHPILTEVFAALKASKKSLHIMGLCSDGGVHAHIRHIQTLLRLANDAGVTTYLHIFTDGRDTPPNSGADFVRDLSALSKKLEHVHIATISGRYYSMDRDQRWERLEKAYLAIVQATGPNFKNAVEAIEASYEADITDEFLVPATIGTYKGLQDGDAILMANFRADRARQLLISLLFEDFKGFARQKKIHFSKAIGMVEYSEQLNAHLATLFAPQSLANMLGEIIARSGKSQLRIAETEKYAHVTFFFNGGREAPYPNEERILIPSPKVATYDLQPEMSSVELTDKLVEAIRSGKFDLIVVNYANTDMVGHTGDLTAATKAVEAVDKALGRVAEAVSTSGGTLFITADHGNAEEMYDDDNRVAHTQHTLNLVPLVALGLPAGTQLKNGTLADLAPTVLHTMGLDIPTEMTGNILISTPRTKDVAHA